LNNFNKYKSNVDIIQQFYFLLSLLFLSKATRLNISCMRLHYKNNKLVAEESIINANQLTPVAT